MSSLNFILMPHILPTSARDRPQIGDCYPVVHTAFGRSTRSADMLQNALQHTDQKRQFDSNEHDRSAVLFFTLYGWKQEDVFLLIIPIVCVHGLTGIVCASVACSFHSLPKQMLALDKIFTTVSSTAFIHTCRYNQHEIKVPWRSFNIHVFVCSWDQNEVGFGLTH